MSHSSLPINGILASRHSKSIDIGFCISGINISGVSGNINAFVIGFIVLLYQLLQEQFRMGSYCYFLHLMKMLLPLYEYQADQVRIIDE